MPQNRQTVLDALRAELAFIESGAYRNPSHAAWRPQFMFEDSPTCLNRDSTVARRPCSECALAGLLPQGSDGKNIPCRYIPLNEKGETIDSFYRAGTQAELESAVKGWLNATIERLEREKAEVLHAQDHPEFTSAENLFQNARQGREACMFSACANPQCCKPFAYGDGELYRFRKNHTTEFEVLNTHCVQHFWLCGDCCKRLTLEPGDDGFVVIKNRAELVWEGKVSRPTAAA